MKHGQTTLTAAFVIGVLILGIVLSWPVIRPLLLSFQGDDDLVNFVLDIAGIAVIISAIIAYFVFRGVGEGR